MICRHIPCWQLSLNSRSCTFKPFVLIETANSHREMGPGSRGSSRRRERGPFVLATSKALNYPGYPLAVHTILSFALRGEPQSRFLLPPPLHLGCNMVRVCGSACIAGQICKSGDENYHACSPARKMSILDANGPFANTFTCVWSVLMPLMLISPLNQVRGGNG